METSKLGEDAFSGEIAHKGDPFIMQQRNRKRRNNLSLIVLFVVILAVVLGSNFWQRNFAQASTEGVSQNSMQKASVKRLANLNLGYYTENDETVFIDSVPIVLWSGSDPKAVLTYQNIGNMTTGFGTETFSLIGGDAYNKLGDSLVNSFPLRSKYQVTNDEEKDKMLNFFDLQNIYNADLDGDGIEELILLRQLGSVEVYSINKYLFGYRLPADALVYYQVQDVYQAKAGGKDILYILFSRSLDNEELSAFQLKLRGALDQSVVLRVDENKVTRLPLGKQVVRDGEILAIGARNLPGSQKIDDLLVLSTRNDKIFLSRHKPDGHIINRRKVDEYFSRDYPLYFAFFSQSTWSIVRHRGSSKVYFFEADKPDDWTRSVDLEPLSREEGEINFYNVVDGDSDPKIIVGNSQTIYALNQDGTYFTWDNGFVPADSLEPFFRAEPPGEGYYAPSVYFHDGESGKFLVVHTRDSGYQIPSFDLAFEAAERFLHDEVISRLKGQLEPSLAEETWAYQRDVLIEEEREKKRIEQKPTTIEEWKTLLPDSYAEYIQIKQKDFSEDVRYEIRMALEYPLDSIYYARNADEAKIWLEAFFYPAETWFELFQNGKKLTSFNIVGLTYVNMGSMLGNPDIAFRVSEKNLTVITTALETSEQVSGKLHSIYEIRMNFNNKVPRK